MTTAQIEDVRPKLVDAINSMNRSERPSADVCRDAFEHWEGPEWVALVRNANSRLGFCYVVTIDPEPEIDTECEFLKFKIGKANDVDARVRSMQSGCPYKMRVDIQLPGGCYTETLLRRMAEMGGYKKSRGEWFCGSGEGFLDDHDVHDASFAYIDAWSNAYDKVFV